MKFHFSLGDGSFNTTFLSLLLPPCSNCHPCFFLDRACAELSVEEGFCKAPKRFGHQALMKTARTREVEELFWQMILGQPSGVFPKSKVPGLEGPHNKDCKACSILGLV